MTEYSAELPERFTERMKELLGKEWGSFLENRGQGRHRGLRVNTLKISGEEFERIAPFHLTRIPWIENGYYVEEEDDPASHPFYAAGLYYLQEPSAMTPASRLPVKPGDRVLDLCAAPGGKATELAARLQGKGFLLANDINPRRGRALLRNLELFGVSNSMVTREEPRRLAELFPGYFDEIMVDAPCSGEGMFRKNPAVMESWKEKGPDYFSPIQRSILLYAADMLKPGGRMLYSTCTFAPEENEGVISCLLQERPEIELIPMEDYEGFSPGIVSFAGHQYHETCRHCRRIWPHHMEGEGHFLALLEKKKAIRDQGVGRAQAAERDQGDPERAQSKRGKTGQTLTGRKKEKRGSFSEKKGKQLTPDQQLLLDGFLASLNLGDLSRYLDIRADKVYYVARDNPREGRMHFIRNGLYLGDLKKNRFEPSQPLALALSAKDALQTVSLPASDPRIRSFLEGESIDLADIWTGDASSSLQEKAGKGKKYEKNSWILLLVEGYPLGWGKPVGTILKNKIPSGWRRRL